MFAKIPLGGGGGERNPYQLIDYQFSERRFSERRLSEQTSYNRLNGKAWLTAVSAVIG